MSDLHKYIIGSAGGVLLCLCCIGGYYFFFDGRLSKTNQQRIANAAGTLQDSKSDVAHHDTFQYGTPPTTQHNGTPEQLTSEQEARLLAARNANASLSKQGTDTEAPAAYPDIAAAAGRENKPIASPADFAKQSPYMQGSQEKLSSNGKLVVKNEHALEKQHQHVYDLITQGKNAGQKQQLNTAIGFFDEAAALLQDDDKAFAAAAYTDMTASLLALSKALENDYNAKAARDKAEVYIRKSIAAESSTKARALYAELIEAQQDAVRRKKQQDIIAQQKIQEKNTKKNQAAQQRSRIEDLIADGKDAALKKQTESVLITFDQADYDMPDDQPFAAASYTAMSDILYKLFTSLSNPEEKSKILNKAEDYIKKALAAQNTARGRSLYAVIINEQKQAEDQKKRAETQKQQELLRAQQYARQQQLASEKEKKLVEQRQKVQELITKGKNAAKKKQLEPVLAYFNTITMPDDKKFTAVAYTDMAHTVYDIATATPNLEKKQAALQKAEEYITQARAAQPTAENAQFYAVVTNAVKQADEQKKAFEAHQKQAALQARQAEEKKKQEAAVAQQQIEKLRTKIKNCIVEGTTALQNKQLNAALDSFNKADELMPDDKKFVAASYQEIAQALFAFAKGSTHEKTVLIAYSRAEHYIRKSIMAGDSLASRNLYEKITKGQQEVLRKQKQLAQKAKEKAAQPSAPAKRSPADIQKSKLAAQGFITQGKKAAATGNFSAAHTFFQKAAESIPKEDAAFSAQKYAEIAESLFTFAKKHTAKKNEALKISENYVKQSIAAKANEHAVHFLYSQIADELKQPKIALKELEQAHKFDENNYVYNYELGKKYFELKEYEIARAFFEKAGKKIPVQ
ncbi:MAG: hypothetical protein ACTTI3_01300 [Treponema sp.]